MKKKKVAEILREIKEMNVAIYLSRMVVEPAKSPRNNLRKAIEFIEHYNVKNLRLEIAPDSQIVTHKLTQFEHSHVDKRGFISGLQPSERLPVPKAGSRTISLALALTKLFTTSPHQYSSLSP